MNDSILLNDKIQSSRSDVRVLDKASEQWRSADKLPPADHARAANVRQSHVAVHHFEPFGGSSQTARFSRFPRLYITYRVTSPPAQVTE